MQGANGSRSLVVTGCFRSGTTLLEKLLSQHEDVLVASQPFPALFTHIKSRFLQSRGLQRRYPLGHLFLERDYSIADFNLFLREYQVTTADLGQIEHDMTKPEAGVMTPEMIDHISTVSPGPFSEVLHQFQACLTDVFPSSTGAQYVGGKEAFVEEFAPFLLGQGSKVVMIIRDPRDVVASTNFATGGGYAGETRPVLFVLRLWRKSVAFAFGLRDHPNFKAVAFESLVEAPTATCNSVASVLGIEPFASDKFVAGLRDQYGDPWRSNSSFLQSVDLDRAATRRFADRLPADVTAFIETACQPEMRVLGYEPTIVTGFDPHFLRSFRERLDPPHRRFSTEPDYSSNPARIADEVRRIELLSHPKPAMTVEEIERWFIQEPAFRLMSDHG